MIDWDYEDRLIDRLAARELLRQIEARKRRMLWASYVRQDTLREIAQVEGLSVGRVGQLVNTTMARLQWLARRAQPPPALVVRVSPPRRRAPLQPSLPGFDRVAFLDHMRRLIQCREGAARLLFARERAELDRMLDDEAISAKAKAKAKTLQASWSKPPPPKPKPLSSPQWLHTPFTFDQGPQRVEPWFDPGKPPTFEGLREIARYALTYFLAAYRPPQWGLGHVGAKSVTLMCERTADAIAGALKLFADGLRGVRLSARPPTLAYPASSVTVQTEAVALGVTYHGPTVSITMTWDEV